MYCHFLCILLMCVALRANEHIDALSQALDDVLRVAFGELHRNYDPAKVRKYVEAMQKSSVTFHAERTDEKNAYGVTRLTFDPDDHKKWKSEGIRFTKSFYEELDDKGRANTALHEITHDTVGTGHGESSKIPNTIVPGRDWEGNQNKKTQDTGNFDDMHKVQTIADARRNVVFGGDRDRMTNMEENADSYSLAAMMCHEIIYDRDFNDVQIEVLMKRNSCPMPTKKPTKVLGQSQPTNQNARGSKRDANQQGVGRVWRSKLREPALAKGRAGVRKTVARAQSKAKGQNSRFEIQSTSSQGHSSSILQTPSVQSSSKESFPKVHRHAVRQSKAVKSKRTAVRKTTHQSKKRAGRAKVAKPRAQKVRSPRAAPTKGPRKIPQHPRKAIRNPAASKKAASLTKATKSASHPKRPARLVRSKPVRKVPSRIAHPAKKTTRKLRAIQRPRAGKAGDPRKSVKPVPRKARSAKVVSAKSSKQIARKPAHLPKSLAKKPSVRIPRHRTTPKKVATTLKGVKRIVPNRKPVHEATPSKLIRVKSARKPAQPLKKSTGRPLVRAVPKHTKKIPASQKVNKPIVQQRRLVPKAAKSVNRTAQPSKKPAIVRKPLIRASPKPAAPRKITAGPKVAKPAAVRQRKAVPKAAPAKVVQAKRVNFPVIGKGRKH
ncbi:hypothetical protein CPB83DRAFT_926278 [Crepidotus variabilis]|uniref:Lysine-specific metallo-endopeptidase domain-containing protein n=1 Tax=Crepidotus variabilis TaxID=179855 RepID=A0A9P6EIJ0_9AGAR|nr:hypothetical protein CPB83DRAFT_926278 [Crepidotus variabilis]